MHHTTVPASKSASPHNHLHDAFILRFRYILLNPPSQVVAHIHHAYEHSLHNPNGGMLTIVVTLVQFTYTTLFGWYASYLFITTKTIWAPIAAHTFCNVMGLPRFFGPIPGASTAQNVLYYLCLVTGAIGFARLVGSIMPKGMTL
jgi:prenyl protein peptidase